MGNEFSLTTRQHRELCNAEMQSIVNFYRFGGMEEAVRVMQYRASRASQQPTLAADCDSQD